MYAACVALLAEAFNWNQPRSATMNERTAGTSGMSQVLRCSVCEARVALERDITNEREVSAGTRIVDVRRFANVIVEEDFASCARCGHKHFALELIDDLETELVTMYQGEHVFARSPLKVLTITELTSEFFLDYEHRLKDPSEKFVPGKKREYIHEYTFNEDNGGMRALKDILEIGEAARKEDTEVAQTNIVYMTKSDTVVGPRVWRDLSDTHPELVEQFSKFYRRYDFDQFQAEIFGQENATYDFIFVAQLKRDRFLGWSGVRARPSEEILVSSWVASGGNVLLGQWGLPKYAETEGAGVDLQELADGFKYEIDDNQQQVLEHLIKRGCFLAWWKQHERLPCYAKERISDALLSPLFKKWQFRKDLHEGEFEVRETLYHRATRANEIHDQYLRTGRVVREVSGAGAGSDEDNDSGINLFVRKMSEGPRLLFSTGYKYFKALEDRLSEFNQS